MELTEEQELTIFRKVNAKKQRDRRKARTEEERLKYNAYMREYMKQKRKER